jgi:hypothetical protein
MFADTKEIRGTFETKFEAIGRKFSNQRKWRDFVTAVECSANYPTIISSMRTRGFLINLANR